MTPSEIERIDSERMVLERLRPEDLDELAALLMHPQMLPMLWSFPTPLTRARIEDMLRAKADHWQRHGFGYWLARDRGTGETVGRGGLQYTYTAGLHDVEVGWAIAPERWGEGLGTEMAQTAVKVAFGPLDLREIVAFTLPGNVASRRVMEKTGFRYEREIVHAGLTHVLYRRRRAAAGGTVTLP